MWNVLLFCMLVFASPSTGLNMADLYSYGDSQGDNRIPVGDDVSSYAVNLQFPITFYGQQYSTLYVSTKYNKVSVS